MARPGRLTPNSPALASSKTETSTRWTDSTLMGNGDQDPQFRSNSRLLIFSGAIDKDRVGVAYFVWSGKHLEKLRFYPWDDLARCRSMIRGKR